MQQKITILNLALIGMYWPLVTDRPRGDWIHTERSCFKTWLCCSCENLAAEKLENPSTSTTRTMPRKHLTFNFSSGGALCSAVRLSATVLHRSQVWWWQCVNVICLSLLSAASPLSFMQTRACFVKARMKRDYALIIYEYVSNACKYYSRNYCFSHFSLVWSDLLTVP